MAQDQGASAEADRAVVNGAASVSALRASVPSAVETAAVRYDPAYPYFGLSGEPVPHQQHPNQRKGLDLYVSVVNFESGEWCFKKLYEGKRGLHFKHTGYSPMYLADFAAEGFIVPFQVFTAQAIEARRAATGTGAVHESAVPQGCAQTPGDSA